MINNMYAKSILATTFSVIYGPVARKWFIMSGIEVGYAGSMAFLAALSVSAAFIWVIAAFLEGKNDGKEKLAISRAAEKKEKIEVYLEYLKKLYDGLSDGDLHGAASEDHWFIEQDRRNGDINRRLGDSLGFFPEVEAEIEKVYKEHVGNK